MTLPLWLLIVTLPLGCLRAVILVMNDTILDRPRDWVKAHGPAKVKEGLECPWCTGLQVALIACALLAWDFTRRFTMWLLIVGTVSILTVVLERVIDRTPKFSDDPNAGVPEAVRQVYGE